jgi:hypothetical protein
MTLYMHWAALSGIEQGGELLLGVGGGNLSHICRI